MPHYGGIGRQWQMKQHISYIFIDYRGQQWKGKQICNGTKIKLQQKMYLIVKKCFFNTTIWIKEENIFKKTL
jgi:hypothetical protein